MAEVRVIDEKEEGAGQRVSEPARQRSEDAE
jgi:hypothetical protein